MIPALKNKSLILASLLSLFFVIRVIAVFMTGNFSEKEMMLGDSWGYSEFAVEINQGLNWFYMDTEFPGKHREPVYPFFVALIYLIFGIKNYLAVYIIQSALGTWMIWLIYKISDLAFNSRPVSFTALIWSGLYFVFLHYSGQLLRETLIFFEVVLLFWIFLRLSKSGQFPFTGLLSLSLVYTLLIHTDGRYLFFAPFLLIIFICFGGRFLRALRKYMVFGGLVILFTIPWTIRNYFAYGEVIVISEMTLNLTGDQLSTRGEHFVFKDIDSVYTTPAFDCNENYPTEEERALVKTGFNPNNRSEEELDLIRRDIYPVKSYLGRKLYFIESLWSPFDFTFNYKPFPWANFEGPFSMKHNILSIICYGLLLPFYLYGIILMAGRKNRSWIILLLPVALQFVLHVLTFGIERYRHPVDAFIIIAGTFGLCNFISVLKNRMTGRIPPSYS